MLHIISRVTGDSGHCFDTHWHKGDSLPEIPENAIDSVRADGDELLYILENFTNLRQCSHRHFVTWRGEDARFIIRNL